MSSTSTPGPAASSIPTDRLGQYSNSANFAITDAYGLVRAQQAGIPTAYHNLVAYKKKYPGNDIQTAREHYDRDLAQKILTHIPSPDVVVCAGWMHILSAGFIGALTSAGVPIINLHPALPGQFNGANAIARAWEAFGRGEITETGVMVHHVISEVDAGEPIVVVPVQMRAGETLAELEERIHKAEWKAIVDGTEIVLNSLKEQRKRAG
ncbi:hypothetical protein DV738_g4059, partial [Chaetothyriales sp. CBS 135597]